MYEICILLAGVVFGVWHCKTVRTAEKRAFRAGQAQARQRARVYRVHACREAIPVPGYSDATGYQPSYERKAVKLATVTQIAQAAKTYGAAAGQVR